MNRITITVPEDLDERLDGLVEEGEYDSKSEAVRVFIQAYDDGVSEYEDRMSEYERRVSRYEERMDALEDDLEDAETRAERLERANLLILEREKKTDALVEYVEAGFWGRLKKSLFE